MAFPSVKVVLLLLALLPTGHTFDALRTQNLLNVRITKSEGKVDILAILERQPKALKLLRTQLRVDLQLQCGIVVILRTYGRQSVK